MITRGLAGAVSLLLVLTSARASDVCLPQGSMYVGVLPRCPTTADSVTVTVYGGFPDLCWSPAIFDSSITQGNLISIYASTVHSGGDLCFGQPVFFGFDVPVGQLSPDSYAVVVTVNIDTGKFAGTYVCDSSFSVVKSGDTNGDGVITSADIILLINHIFKSGQPPCGRTGDVNCDGLLGSADVIHLVGYVFKSGPPPVEFCSP